MGSAALTHGRRSPSSGLLHQSTPAPPPHACGGGGAFGVVLPFLLLDYGDPPSASPLTPSPSGPVDLH